MQIVIELDEEEFKDFVDCGTDIPPYRLYGALFHGIPLPKEHGRLIDAKEFEAYIKDGFRDLKGKFKTEKYRSLAEQLTESFLLDIQEQKTVVPADKEVSE